VTNASGVETTADMGNKLHSEDEDLIDEVSNRVKSCDPWAVYSAKRFRKMSGIKGTEGLTDQQRAIYEFIQFRGKVTIKELSSALHLPPPELENQLAILRHCGLVKGQKEDDKVYLTLF